MAETNFESVQQYLLSLGITPSHSFSDVEHKIIEASDQEIASELLNAVNDRANKIDKGDSWFYSFKNQTYNLSMAVSSAFDGDILKRACNWIMQNKDCFGKTILEIGCDTGIMSCFLAKTFPDAED